MLLQTNSYIVPKEKRAAHDHLMQRFRQVLTKIGCDHFEVFEQVGANWAGGETSGRFVQLLKFRDRKHCQAVQLVERKDPAAQSLVREFVELINFPYQEQQGLFAYGYYNAVIEPIRIRPSPLAFHAYDESVPESGEVDNAEPTDAAVTDASEVNADAEPIEFATSADELLPGEDDLAEAPFPPDKKADAEDEPVPDNGDVAILSVDREGDQDSVDFDESAKARSYIVNGGVESEAGEPSATNAPGEAETNNGEAETGEATLDDEHRGDGRALTAAVDHDKSSDRRTVALSEDDEEQNPFDMIDDSDLMEVEDSSADADADGEDDDTHNEDGDDREDDILIDEADEEKDNVADKADHDRRR